MKQEIYEVPTAGGLETRLPQTPENASVAENLKHDRKTGGWSTRLGYEKYFPYETDWSPFDSAMSGNIALGPIYSLHVAQMLAGGARQHTLFEADGSLFLLYEASGVPTTLLTLATDRHVPTTTEAASWYTDTPYGTIITNGVNRPVLVNPWPLGQAPPTQTYAQSMIGTAIRDFGFTSPPPPVDPHRNVALEAGSPITSPNPTKTGGGATTIYTFSDSRAIADGARWGLGFEKNTEAVFAKEALFGWAVSFITDTGSEGPKSTLATTSWQLPGNAQGFRHAVALDIPLGPEGTVARRLYRTTNFSDDYTSVGDTTLYFIDDVRNNVDELFIDCVRTAALGAASPIIPTGPLPAPQARFSAMFQNCLFLDGGIVDSRNIYYSAPGLIEQFDSASFFTLSAEGGGITAMYSNYTTLIVFRERSIDVVTGDYASGFKVNTIANGITCQSPHSVQSIPGLGLVFLALDGLYALTGGLQGGAINDIVKLTGNQDETIERITPDCFSKAVSCYSALHREYHLYVPYDGNDRPNKGFVLHADRIGQGNLSALSTREGFPVGAIATRADGTIIFGHNTGTEGVPVVTNVPNRGLFVISGKRSMGYGFAADALYPLGPPTSRYRSAWFDFGDAQIKKQVSYVTLWVLTTGQPTITMRHYKDFSLRGVSERTYVMQPPDQKDLPVFDTVILDNKGIYEDHRLVPVRYSIAQQSCSWFSFEIETTDDLIFIGYELEYTTKGTRVVMGKRA
tara:strand:- start:8562 stop:10781 length:2220 start_codon:yes stop_codon:yes gene_type:complete